MASANDVVKTIRAALALGDDMLKRETHGVVSLVPVRMMINVHQFFTVMASHAVAFDDLLDADCLASHFGLLPIG